MQKFEYVIRDPEGIHARPAGLLIQEVKKYNCTVTLENKGKTADAKRLLAVMSLAAKCGETLTVTVVGENEETVATEIKTFLENNF